MVRLSGADYVSVLQAAHDVAGVARQNEFAPTVLQRLAGLVRSDVATLNEIDPAAGRFSYTVDPIDYGFPDGAEAVFGELVAQHPLIRHQAESGDGSARKISDVVTVQAWHDSEIYRRFYSWVGVEHQMSITLPAPAPIVVGLALNRAEGDFDERDRTVLNLLRPHLAQSWRRVREYERLEDLLHAASGALTHSGPEVIVLSDPIQELTPGALVSLYRFFGRPAPRDALPVRVRHWLDTQQARLAETELELARPLNANLDSRQLVLRYLPGVHGRPDVLLLDERAADAEAGTLRDVGLTDRETVVLRLLGTGATNIQIARELSLSQWTVKRHLSNIYSKLGVHSRVGAAAVALEIEAHHRPVAEG